MHINYSIVEVKLGLFILNFLDYVEPAQTAAVLSAVNQSYDLNTETPKYLGPNSFGLTISNEAVTTLNGKRIFDF